MCDDKSQSTGGPFLSLMLQAARQRNWKSLTSRGETSHPISSPGESGSRARRKAGNQRLTWSCLPLTHTDKQQWHVSIWRLYCWRASLLYLCVHPSVQGCMFILKKRYFTLLLTHFGIQRGIQVVGINSGKLRRRDWTPVGSLHVIGAREYYHYTTALHIKHTV